MPSFEASKAGYALLWGKMQISPNRLIVVQEIAAKLVKNKARYEGLDAPWWFVAILDEMEGGGNANYHLHNGDPLTERTVHVPAGRPPPPAQPPFTFQQSAADALAYQGLDTITDWSVERALYEFEKYNGFGYYSVGINSPYLWSFSSNYTAGKFVEDGKYDANAVSKQAGVAPILKEMMALDKTILTTAPTPPTPTPVPVPPLPPQPPVRPSDQPSMLGLTLAQWAAVIASDPTIVSDISKLRPEALAVIERLIRAVEASHGQ